MNFKNKIYNKIKSKKPTNYLGFSLIELIIVIAIMAVLIGLVSPAVVQYVHKNKMKACRQNREAILAVYQRCVYDSSVEITLNAADLARMIPATKSGEGDTNLYAPVRKEVVQYSTCPIHDNVYTSCGIGDPTTGVNTGTAWIYCGDCEDYAVVDMVGWENHTYASSDDLVPSTPTPSPTPVVDQKWKVSFNLNGHGSPKPDDIEVMDGDTIKSSQLPSPKDPLYKFMGWYNEASCLTLFSTSTPIKSNITLYAKWEGVNSSSVWPYADDPSWWTEEGISTHAGAYTGYDFTNSNEQRIYLKAPSGIFTSKAGGQFVFIDTNGDGSGNKSETIYQHRALSPEYYIATGSSNFMMQISGQVWTYELSDVKEKYGGQITENVQVGDLIYFEDTEAGTAYIYVVKDTPGMINYGNIDDIRNYSNHPGNIFKVQVNPEPISSYK